MKQAHKHICAHKIIRFQPRTHAVAFNTTKAVYSFTISRLLVRHARGAARLFMNLLAQLLFYRCESCIVVWPDNRKWIRIAEHGRSPRARVLSVYVLSMAACLLCVRRLHLGRLLSDFVSMRCNCDVGSEWKQMAIRKHRLHCNLSFTFLMWWM